MVKRRKPSGDVAAPAQAAAIRPPATYAPTLNAGFQATTLRVQEMHQAISGTTFDHLLRVPGLSVPTRIVQGLHDAIAQGVYAAVRHGGGAALTLAGEAERIATDPARVPGAREQAARSALNGVFGDSLRDAGSALAIRMGLHAGGAPLASTPDALQGLRARVCVFIHGLACDERSWALRNEAWQASPWADLLAGAEPLQYGALLERECGVSATYLRYNTGLAIEHNAEQLNALLAEAAAAAPQVREWVLIGHSMGGLVARRAQAIAAPTGARWAAASPMLVCIGSPHQGAPLEQVGRLAAAALNAADVTQPLGRIANARSQGIKDLRSGLKSGSAPAANTAPSPALRLVFGTLGDEADAGVGSLIGKVLGDGLVMPGSAADAGLTGDVERVELAGLGHMGLLNHPRVYAVLRRWLGAPELKPAPDAAPRG
jgi:pimeloyl-ACP methyl ester carboxylesterase